MLSLAHTCPHATSGPESGKEDLLGQPGPWVAGDDRRAHDLVVQGLLPGVPRGPEDGENEEDAAGEPAHDEEDRAAHEPDRSTERRAVSVAHDLEPHQRLAGRLTLAAVEPAEVAG